MNNINFLINLKQNKWWHIGLLILLPLCIYIQSLSFDYTNFDDNGIILQKFDVVGNLHNIDTAFKVDAFFNKTGDFYRPVQNVSFMLDAAISKQKLWMFHISNLVIHILTCISLYFFLQLLNIRRYPSFLLALLFAVHPLFASCVGWIPSRGDTLIGLLGVLLFLTFGLYFRTKKIIYFILHVLLFLITIFTKETTVFFPLFFLYYYFFVLPKPIEAEKFTIKLLRLIPFFIFWAGIFVFYFILRRQVVANTGATADVLGIIPFFKNNTVIPTIIGKFFIPFNLSTLPLYNNASTIVGIVFLLFVLYLTVEFSIQKQWAVLMGLLWFLLFAAPPTIYRLDNADTFFNYLEHRTYLPMIGVVIILGFFLNDKLPSPVFAKRFTWIYIPVILVFSILAFIHCADYKDNFTLANRAANLDNPSGLSMRAGDYMNKKDTANALSDIDRAIELNPKDANMFFSRGKIRAKMLEHEAAEQDFTLAISLNPGLIDAYMARSVEKRYLKKYEGAFRDIDKAVKLDSTNPKIYFSFGNLFVATDDYNNAIKAFSQSILLKKDYGEAYNNRAYAKLFLHDYSGSIEDGLMAQKLMPPNPFVFDNLGQAYRESNNLFEAFKNFDKAIELDKNFAQAYYERGKAWQKSNDMTNACIDWKHALDLRYAQSKEMVEKYCK
jgi:tetratricopeptide (TPR) repeat protein